MRQPLGVHLVDVLRQSPSGRENNSDTWHRFKDCVERFHASRRELRRRVLALGVGDEYAADVEEDDRIHGGLLSGIAFPFIERDGGT